jgi:predicted ATP-binding protein involved in virulence
VRCSRKSIKSLSLNKYKIKFKNSILYLLVGPPGAGKSMWVGNHRDCNDSIIISRDASIIEVGAKYAKNSYDDAYDFTYDSLCKLISDIHTIIVRTIEPIRPGRRYPRNFNNRSGRFHYGYQPIR